MCSTDQQAALTRHDGGSFLNIRRDDWPLNDLMRIISLLGDTTHARQSKSRLLERINPLYRNLLSEQNAQETIEKIREIAADRVEARRKYGRRLRAGRKTDCMVCTEEAIGIGAMPKDEKIVFSCLHKLQICRACLITHIDTQLQTTGFDGIKCPHEGCPEVLDERAIRVHASLETIRRYEAYLLKQAFGDETSFRLCAHPGCSGGGLVDVAIDSFMICEKCGGKTCLSCECIWHTDVTCEENRERKAEAEAESARREAEDTLSQETVARVAKICPNKKCGWRIQRAHGCDHMTCKYRSLLQETQLT